MIYSVLDWLLFDKSSLFPMPSYRGSISIVLNTTMILYNTRSGPQPGGFSGLGVWDDPLARLPYKNKKLCSNEIKFN